MAQASVCDQCSKLPWWVDSRRHEDLALHLGPLYPVARAVEVVLKSAKGSGPIKIHVFEVSGHRESKEYKCTGEYSGVVHDRQEEWESIIFILDYSFRSADIRRLVFIDDSLSESLYYRRRLLDRYPGLATRSIYDSTVIRRSVESELRARLGSHAEITETDMSKEYLKVFETHPSNKRHIK